jgi:hypothetical protein
MRCVLAIALLFTLPAHADETRKIHVSFLGAGSGVVVFSPPSIDMQVSCNGTCEYAWPAGTAVTLTAIAAADSTFGDWGGWCQKKAMPPGTPSTECNLTLEGGDRLAKVTFSKKRQ